MSLIDFTQMQTATDKAEADLAAHLAATRTACSTRIHAFCSPASQLNLAAAAAAGRLKKADKLAHVAMLDWIDAMRATATRLGADPRASITEDANWPAPPEGVAECIARF